MIQVASVSCEEKKGMNKFTLGFIIILDQSVA